MSYCLPESCTFMRRVFGVNQCTLQLMLALSGGVVLRELTMSSACRFVLWFLPHFSP